MPEITVDPAGERIDANHVRLSGTYEVAGSFGGTIALTLSNGGASKGGGTVPASSGGTWQLIVAGGAQDGEATVHAVISQMIPPANDAYDGPVTVA